MTRRQILLSAGALPTALAATAAGSQLSVEAYIFQQYAKRQGKSLAEVLPEVIPMAKQAGFNNIELNGSFLEPLLRKETLALLRRNQLMMPSVYSGGPMHTRELADKTIAQALDVAAVCQPFGCAAVVCNADAKGPEVEKGDAELASQSASFDEMGRRLKARGFDLRVHNHTPEMLSGAREWRYTLQHTNPDFVSLCLDLDWVHQGGQDPLALLREAGSRVHEIHVRNSRDKLWLEDFAAGDVDYSAIEAYLKTMGTKPLIVVELAYREQTIVTRPLVEDLARSRRYAERIFRIKARNTLVAQRHGIGPVGGQRAGRE